MSRRDPRFIARHRGGSLEPESHATLARWAANCAETVLPKFEQTAQDLRPRKAIETVRAWASGKVRTGVAMKASVAAHAAARAVEEPLAMAAARSAGQAAATAHAADHCMGALLYLLKTRKLLGQGIKEEMKKQMAKLPRNLQGMVKIGVGERLGIAFGQRHRPALTHVGGGSHPALNLKRRSYP